MKLDPKLIDPNPYQPRGELGDLSDLVASLKAHGLQQKPSVRAVGKRYQLQFGHRRHAAWQAAFPGQLIEVEVIEATDQQMFEAAIVENEHRQGINPIERAQAMKRYIDEFHVSQAEAGTLFGLASQGAVSNAMRLLKLPGPIMKAVEAGELPERLARQLIVTAEVFPADAIKIAQKVAEAEPEDKQFYLDDGIEMLMRSKGRYLYHSLFTPEWPKEEIPVKHKSYSTIGTCTGCRFFITRKGQKFCGRPDCFDLKTFIFIRTSIAPKTAEVLGLKVGAEGELGDIIFQGEEKEQELAKAALAIKHESLRIVPNPKPNGSDYWRSHILVNILGNANVALGTTNLKALKEAIALAAKATPGKKSKDEKAKDAERRSKEKEAERTARNKEIERLTLEAADYFAKVLPTNPALLKIMAEAYMDGYGGGKEKVDAACWFMEEYFNDLIDEDLPEHSGLDFTLPKDYKIGLAFLAKRLGMKPMNEWTADLLYRDSRFYDSLHPGWRKKLAPAATAKPKGKKK